MADKKTAAESVAKAERSNAGSCSSCGRPLTHVGPDGECLRCLFDWGATAKEEPRNAGVAPGPLRYGLFEVERDPSGFPIALGAGAMAVTYRARDTVLDSLVALKVISLKLAENPIARARFLREARAAAQIHHPNVARVTHYGEQDGEYFYAMELVEGETLQARVQREGPLPLSLALEVIEQAARGLAAGEACGVVHRDLKPSNLMIASDASELLLVKIIDYGVAKVVASQSDTIDQTQGGFIGTPAFASPEQFAESERPRIDTRSDIYSLGVTLWYLLTGQTPFRGETLEQIRSSREELPLEQLKAVHVPAKVVALLKSILAVDPAKRPQTVRELLAAVHRCHEKFEPKARLRRKRWILATAGIALLFTAVIIATLWHQRAQSLAGMERSIAVLPFENGSANSEDGFFADGMRDEIAAGLAGVSKLKVIGSKSTRSYVAGKTRNLAAIGRDLGVQYVLEGTVSRANGDLRVSLRLVDLHDSRHSWSNDYQRPINDVFALQKEITRTIVAHLQADLSPNEAAALDLPPTTDLRAYESYLRAGAIRAAMSDDPVAQLFSEGKRAISLLEDAVTRDPNFVAAYSQLAKWHDDLYFQRNVGPAEEKTIDHRSLAETALTKALLLQPDSGVVHMALALHALQITRDVDEAQVQINLARVALPPNAELETIAGRVARRQDRWDEALQCFQRALQLEPRDVVLLILLADTNRCMRRYVEFDHYISEAIDLTPPEKLGLLPVHRALGRLESSADIAPLRAAITAQVTAHQLDDADIASAEMNIAVWSHDAAAISRFLRQKHAEVSFNGVKYPDAWFEALAARMRGDKRAAVSAFSIARTQMQESVQLMATEGVPLSILAIIDAGLGRKEDAINEAMRASQLSTFKANNLDATTVRCNLAIVYAWTGETDLALAKLNELVDRPASSHAVCQPTFGDFQLNPLWDPLRSDPRFKALIQRLAPPASK